jgi:polyisoprenoid-binding protein YceI
MSTHWMKERFPTRLLVVGTVLLGLAGCQTSPPAAETPAATPVPQSTIPAIPADAKSYPIVPEESLLQILVYRGGAMARLGHNHVIASQRLTGTVFVSGDATRTRFDLLIPVNELTIDEPAMREQAGADFPPGVPQSARDGTRRNLLSPALLDGANYPTIRLRCTDVVAVGEGFDVGVEITLKDQVRNMRVPVNLERKAGALKATGEFPLKQSELGFKPFSVAMGSLVVLDEMRILFEVVAKVPGGIPHPAP